MRIPNTLVAAITVIAATSGPALSDEHTMQNSWQGEARDAWLDGKVETALLLNDHLNNFEIDTDVENTMVVLSGQVSSEVEKQLAGQLALNIDGVSNVENNIQIVEGDMGPVEPHRVAIKNRIDAVTITARINVGYAASAELSAANIDVDTDKGVVTLSGTVENAAAEALAVEIAESYDGVTEVNSNLTLVR